jgi:hypothetical protein
MLEEELKPTIYSNHREILTKRDVLHHDNAHHRAAATTEKI